MGLRVGDAENEREQAASDGQGARYDRFAVRVSALWLTSRTAPPIAAGTARARLTYRHQRQVRYSVSAPPTSSPIGGAAAGDRGVDPERGGPLLARRRMSFESSVDRAAGAKQSSEHALGGSGGDQHVE